MLTARSWCTGYTGLEMAVRAAFGDFTVLSHSDIKPAAAALLAHRYPDIPNLGDMRQVDHTALAPADLMIGSWPCGPHSPAGNRLGEDDPRDLWPEYLRAIDAHRPSIFFGENVGRITSNGELRRVVTSLAQRGYVGSWIVRSAADSGACHLRKRCFVIAVDPATHADIEAGRLSGHPQQGDGASTAGSREAEPGRRNLRPVTLLPTPAVHNQRGPESRGARADGYARTARQTNLPNVAIQAFQGALLPTPKASDGPKGGPGMRGSSGDLALPSAVQPINFGMYAEAVQHHEQVFGWPAPAPAHSGLNTPRPQLSARFVEWMQMVPEGWVCDVPNLGTKRSAASDRNAMLSLLGDGVCPPQGAAAFRFLLDHLVQRLEAGWAA